MKPAISEIVATLLFAIAILHTFSISRFEHLATKFREGSVGENFFHFIGEVEVVMGLWAGILLVSLAMILGPKAAIAYSEGLDFSEPLFVFVIMVVAATQPVIAFARGVILGIARVLPIRMEVATYISCLVIGPLLGSFITEPAAMTVTALILRDRYFLPDLSTRFKYLTLAVLFVNISIGGVLTPFAAPPVLMVAEKWKWGMGFMISNLGWKSAVAAVINAMVASFILKKELFELNIQAQLGVVRKTPFWLTCLHLGFLVLIVFSAHHPVVFVGTFLFFIGVTFITREYQDDLKFKESLLVAFFLGGLVVLGGMQGWWLKPIIQGLDALPLYLGAAALTAFTDNAAITYLGSQVSDVSEMFKYALVAGAIAGGGLTVIANAPNPAGFSILQDRFGEDGIHPMKLLLAAIFPTLIALVCLWFLP